MTLNRILFFLILIILSAFSQPGIAQDQQDAFKKELIAACQENSISNLETLIHENRLKVKPIINQLISEYITQFLASQASAAASSREKATILAQTFEEIHGEKSLVIATAYLDQWTMEQLGKKAQADRIYGIATDLRKSGEQTEEAIRQFLHALDLYADIGDVRGQGEVLGGLGYIYWFIDADTCLRYYQRALKARTQADDKVLIGATLNSIGGVYFMYFGELDSARHYYEQAVTVRDKIGDLAGLGSSLFNLARVYGDLGQLEPALHCFGKSYTVHQELDRQDMMAESKLRSGTYLRLLGRYPEATEDLKIAISLSLELADTIILADSYTQMALAYDNTGDYTKGIELVTIATGLYRQVDDQWGLAGAYNHTGIILQDAGRKQRAEEFYLKALEIYQEFDDQENVISVLNNLGTVSFEQDEFTEAEAYNRQGLELSRKLEHKAGELPCLINLANSQNRLEKLDSAIQNYKLALKLAKELKSPDSEWRILVGMAENCKLRGDYPSAIKYNEHGLTIIEELRSTFHSTSEKSNYLARERYAFEDVIHMLATQHERDPGKGYDLLAFEYAQRSKSRSFLEEMEGSDPVTIKQVQDAELDENSVILEFSLGDSSSVLWVITPEAYQIFRLPDRETLEQQVETFRFALLNPEQDNKTFLQQSGYFLYQQLIQPAEDFITKNSQVLILPDGILHYIPFEVLITREPKPGEDKAYGTLSYLGKKTVLSYGQSASVFLSMMNDRSKSAGTDLDLKELVAFGDPVYKEKHKRLEHSGNEVKSIAALFPEAMAKTYLQEEASEENIKNENILSAYRYIHFATHGTVDEENPGRSGLILSQENSSVEDGIFRADEITAFELNADMVVLSACQTGIGKMIRGEGMIGLSRSFMYAGVPSVVVSLWSVSDQSTSILMKRFYAYLVLNKRSKAEALHLARISMMNEEQYAHPFFWAPFVLTGDWQ